jgi:hypothetical protein
MNSYNGLEPITSSESDDNNIYDAIAAAAQLACRAILTKRYNVPYNSG